MICRDPNHARAHEIEPLHPKKGKAPRTPTAAAPKSGPRRSPRVEAVASRLFDMTSKKEIFRRYAEWKANGSGRADSPIADLHQEYGCHQNYPKKLFDKCLAAPVWCWWSF